MNRIEEKFQTLKAQNRKALIIYLTAGFPNLDATSVLVPEMEKAGADIIELGVPFSDPVADGVTIQRTSAAALKSGANLPKILRVVSDIRRHSQIPIILMGYYNPILAYGPEKFTEDCGKYGVDGLIIPDLPPDEADVLLKLSAKNQIGVVFLLAPTSTEDRITLVCEKSYPFIYYVSVAGVTGARKSLPSDIKAKIDRIRQCTDKLVCLGFGISNAEQAREVRPFVDGVIVGSALLNRLEKSGPQYLRIVSNFVSNMAAAVHDQ